VALCVASSGYGIDLPGFVRRWAWDRMKGSGRAAAKGWGWGGMCVVVDVEASLNDPPMLICEVFDLLDPHYPPFAFDEI
jgi:hypothetical protein